MSFALFAIACDVQVTLRQPDANRLGIDRLGEVELYRSEPIVLVRASARKAGYHWWKPQTWRHRNSIDIGIRFISTCKPIKLTRDANSGCLTALYDGSKKLTFCVVPPVKASSAGVATVQVSSNPDLFVVSLPGDTGAYKLAASDWQYDREYGWIGKLDSGSKPDADKDGYWAVGPSAETRLEVRIARTVAGKDD